MAPNSIRLVVSTPDTAFYSMVNVGILRAGGIGTLFKADNAAGAESKFAPNMANILIIDIDRCLVNQAFLRGLREKFKLLIILTGGQGALVATLAKAGFTDFITKPKTRDTFAADMFARAVRQKINAFLEGAAKLKQMDMFKIAGENSKIIAVAASTGGTDALEKILKELGADIPPMLVVQHMPSGFTKLYADRLNNACRMEIKEAANNDYLRSGVVYIAPADYHMALVKNGAKLALRCFVGAKVHGVMPAADVLFDSIAPIMKANAVGVILTGMGADGAKGLHKMHLNGAKTIGQNKETCIVYGMPKVAYDLGAVDEQLPLKNIASAIMRLCRS